MRGLYILLIGASLACFQESVYASDFNYNYISAGYVDQSTSLDGVSKDLKTSGYQLNGSFDVSPQFDVTVGVVQETGDVTISSTKVKMNLNAAALGLLYHTPISTNTDVIIGASLSQARAKATATGLPASKDTVNGHAAFVSLRTKITNILELIAGINQSYADNDSTTSYNIEMAAHINKDFAVGVGYSTDKDSHAAKIDLYKFF